MSNIFEDNFYIESVERYNVKYKPSTKKTSTSPNTNGSSATPNNAYINGSSGASGGIQNNLQNANFSKIR